MRESLPPADPRHALTAELLDLIQGATPERPRRRLPWHPDILIEAGTRWLAGREAVAAVNAQVDVALAEAMESPRERRNRLRREERAAAREAKAASAAQGAVGASRG